VLNASNSAGSSLSTQVTFINVTAETSAPVADFTFTPASGPAPLYVTFTDTSTSTAAITNWAWNFGDNVGSSSEQNPVYTYPNAGMYTVSLMVTDANGGINTKSVPGAVTVHQAPVANFTFTPVSGTAPLGITFTDTSTSVDQITTWAWTFGDGSSVNASNQNPVHIYATGGLYMVNLTVTDTNLATNTKSVTGAVTVIVPPVANFTSNVTSGTAPWAVQFNDTSINNPALWNWSFTNVTPGNNTQVWWSAVQNATQTFGVGNYSIVLNASNSAGSSLSTQVTFINVTAAPIAPVASFTSNVTAGIAPLAVQFNDTSINTPTGWNWSFTNVTGNNTQVWFSTLQAPVYTFGAGNYSIVLNASNSAGSNLTTQVTFINVTAGTIAPVAGFNANHTGGTAPLTVAFTDTSTNTPIGWIWNATNVTGNNTPFTFSTEHNPTQTFGVGNYSIVLNASNSAGSNLTTQFIFINVTAITVTNATSETGVYRPGVGFYLKMDNGSTWTTTDKYLAWDNATGDHPIAGDWNADGRVETGVYRPGGGFYLKMDNGSTWTTTDKYLAWDNAAGDLPIAGDWNADGTTETGVYRPGVGFYLKMDNGSTWTPSTDRYLAWDNWQTDLPIAGDWNGDGRAETGVYRPGDGFYLKMDNGNTWTPSNDLHLTWDNAVGDLPIAGDWNGDGQIETGVYRPGVGFYLKMDNGSTWTPSTDQYLAWDNWQTDLPIAGNFG
jgi:PKD repeat protein